jgi:hypothetical protein
VSHALVKWSPAGEKLVAELVRSAVSVGDPGEV